eukprot:COSAG05_NODE_3962_length_1750_cov_1.815869_2_plen_60_part_00
MRSYLSIFGAPTILCCGAESQTVSSALFGWLAQGTHTVTVAAATIVVVMALATRKAVVL